MTQRDPHPIRIQQPCPMQWEQLVGDDRRRFCEQCSLHVINGSKLLRDEARALVDGATGRVCMRLELDELGAPVFADRPPVPARARLSTGFGARAWRFPASLVSLLLAACTRQAPATAPGTPETPSSATQTSTILGKVAPRELLGDVAEPPPRHVLGEVGPGASPAQAVTPEDDRPKEH